MRIANPIYDVVFKYLLEDKLSAVLLLEALTGFRIKELELQPQEKTSSKKGVSSENDKILSIEERFGLTVFRLDFKALVTDEKGQTRVVIIELQKAMRGGDIMRFRSYLGKQYADSSLFSMAEISGAGRRLYKRGHEIFSIYILGSPLPQVRNIPVIRIKKQLIDRHSGEECSVSDDFVNSLYHEGLIVSVSSLRGQNRDELERLLSIFDQTFAVPELQNHILELEGTDFPEQYKRILERLFKAAQSQAVREIMDKQDEALAEYQELDSDLRRTKQSLKETEASLKETEQSLERTEQSLERTEQSLERTEQSLERTEQSLKDALEKSEEEKKEKEQALKREKESKKREETLRTGILQNPHIDEQAAAVLLGISPEEVRRYRESENK